MENMSAKRNIKPFNGEKYSVWKYRIRALLTELDVIKVIDSDVPEVPNAAWNKAERIAKSVIIEYLSDSCLSFAKPESSAKDIFNYMDSIYERKSLATQIALRKKLLSLKLEDDAMLTQHFTNFDTIVSNLLAAGSKLEETDQIAHLLVTLPNSYNSIVTAIETLSENNITLAFVKTRLLDHEIKLRNENKDTSAKVLHVKTKFNTINKTNFKPQFQVNKNKFKYNKNNRNHTFNKKPYAITCNYCNKKGHMKRQCFYYNKRFENQNLKRTETAQTVQSANNVSSFAFMTGNYQSEEDNNNITFILDSGATEHIINREDLTENFTELETPIKISVAKAGTSITATKRGTINVISNMGIQGTLNEVLYCPEVPYNLLSVSKMQKAGMTVTFNQKHVKVLKGGKTVIEGKTLNNLIVINFKIDVCKINAPQVYSNIKIDYELWHQRLGHISKNKFLELKNKQMVNDIAQIDKIMPNDNLCEACISGKQCRLPFNKAKNKSYVERPLFIVNSDISGPITPSTINDKHYFILFVDEYTHYCVTYLIKYKSEAFSVFKDYVAKSEAHFNLKVVNLYCDNGREYLSNEMKNYCVQKGISYHLTVPHTPQLNGVSERMVRTITEKARTMLAGAKLNKAFWGEAVLTSTFLINITPTRALKQVKTPYEMWHCKKPEIKYLKVFGSTVYVHNKIRKTKFDEKSWKGILVGYEPNGYKVWDVENEKFVVVRDVIVNETEFLATRPVIISDVQEKSHERGNSTDTVKELRSDINSDNIISNDLNKLSPEKSDNKTDCIVEQNTVVHDDKCKRRSDRIKSRPPVNYIDNKIQNDYIMIAQSIVCQIPNSYQEINSRDDKNQWQQAIKDEINSLLLNNTWTLVSKPKNKNIIDCRWVFAIKHDEFGNPLKYKARLVAKGFSQKYLVDYNETFAPVARISSFRFIIAFANQFNLLIHHMDVKTAFLNGELKEEIYMRIPEGVKSHNNQVCKLNKALYGLKQAARCWFEKFETTLKEKGFQNSPVDRCIYILDKGEITENIYIILYVDDLVIVSANIDTINSFKHYLMNKFSMVDLKEIKLFLGIRVIRNNNKITLDQSAYIKTILTKFNMYDSKAVHIPLESKLDYEALNSDQIYDAPCRNLVGCLIYVMTCTRPDLSIAVNILSRYVNKNNEYLWKCLKRVLKYLKGSIDIKLTYVRGNYNNILIGYVDSDWGGNDINDRKSTTGYLFKLFEQCTICWSSKRQGTVAASSTEAEYMALFEAVKEALWLKSLAESIKLKITEPILIYEDNNGCISIANNPTDHKRTKHIDIKYHFSREQIENNIIKLKYVPTGDQLADALTKPLPGGRFIHFRRGVHLY